MAKKPTNSNSNNPPPQPAVPVVAIGASAGGLVAVTELLQNLSSTTGLAYVYIQHVDPSYVIRLADSLASATIMPVLEAGHLMRVEPNHVYVIPPDKDLEIVDGVLTLVPRPRRTALHMPVDQFFQSLAERQRDGAVAVVLSGIDGDGTQGLKAIKAAGGFTFAQDDTAQFQSMPKSAIAEGVVDRVLPPAGIARELERLSRQPDIFRQTNLVDSPDEFQPTPDEDLRAVLNHLRKSVGVDFTHYKVTTVQRRVLRRMLLLKLDTLKDYLAHLRQHTDESMALYNDLLINVTTFFRDAETMDYLKKVVLPQVLRDKPPRVPLRIWVSACSTGQEAYSIAMLVLEVLGERANQTSIQIFATDLSEQAIAKARLGSYSRSEVADVSAKRLQQFFTKHDDHYRVNKFIRDLCVFAPHNVFRDPPFSRLDLVSCRNLLIYLDGVLQRKALSTFHYALNPGGYLVLGKSETVGSSATLFAQVEKNYKVYARKNDVTSRASFEMQPRPAGYGLPDDRPAAGPMPPVERDESGQRLTAADAAARRNAGPRGGTSGPGDLDQIIDNLLLTEYVPASVVVNADLDILQFRGSTSLYLEPAPGRASLNLLKMARPSLTFELRNAVHKAGQSDQPVRKAGLEVKVGNQTHTIAIEVAPILTGSDERLFLITFQEMPLVALAEANSTKARSRRIKQLEDELAAVRHDMHAIIEEQEASNEELQSANEEIVSSNEELQSINEELETSKEEIESTNEELLTINQELQIRNEQLTEAYEFAETIFATLHEATLVLDPVLRVRSANQTFYEMFGLRQEETEGRLLPELDGRQWDIPALRDRLDQVILHDTQVRDFEMTYQMPASTTTVPEAKILLLNARRVVRQGQQEAILMAMEDVTEHRRVQRLLAEREAWFHNIADNAPSLTWVAGDDGRYTFFNRAWLDYTGRTLEDELVRGWALDIHSDDRDRYQERYQQCLAQRQPFQAEYRLRQRDGEHRWMLENARPTFDLTGRFTGYIGSATDIHLQKTLNQELDRRVRERTDELATTNEMMQIALSASRAGLGRWDWRNGTAVWDARGREIIGFTGDGEMGRADGWFGRIHPDDRQRIRDLTQTSMRTGEDFRAEYRVVHDDGSVHYVLGAGRMKQDADGQPLESTKLVIDITDLKRAEEQAQQERRRLAEAQAIGHVGSFEWTVGEPFTYWSDELYRMHGLEPQAERIPIDQAADFVYPDNRPAYERLRAQALQSPGRYELVHRLVRRDGGVRWVRQQCDSLADDAGAVVRVRGTVQDITEQHEADEQMRQLATNLQAVLNTSPAAIGFLKAVYDQPDELEGKTTADAIRDFRLVVCNDKFARLTGKSQTELLGQPADLLAGLLWDGGTVWALERVVQSGESIYEERPHVVDGQERWLGLSATRHDGGVVLTGLDITPLKQAGKEQDRLLDQLANSQLTIQELEAIRQHIRERGEFLRQTSHDLRGSFGVIQGTAQLLDLVDTDEERAQMLAMLQRNLRQVTALLTQLLDYSRLEAGQEQVNVTPFDAADLLRNLGDNLRPLANERGLTLTTDGPDTLPVEGDAVKVQRIAQNLALNALKYTRTGGVTIRWQADADGWTLGVDDTGPGLPAETVQQLTNESSVVAPSLKPAPASGGEGIGLSIVRGLVTLLKARLWVDSVEGVGTHFRVSFERTDNG